MLAVVDPPTLPTATDTPIARPPVSPPIALVETVRFVSASTLTPPPACGIFAPVSM